jgi:GDPmannose 4,6-dehydratase
MSKRRALITGAAGQDGTYLAGFLLSKEYEVFGIDAPGRAPRSALTRFTEFDIRNADRLAEYIKDLRPDECYHLAAFHRSSSARTDGQAAEDEIASIQTNLLSVQTVLSTLHAIQPDCRVFLAGSCHVFGDAVEIPQTEQTPFAPANIYGITKSAAAHLGRLYRGKGMYACTGILYNHESPLRSPDFVTAKIAKAAADIRRESANELTIGNLDAQVDWGFAGDYVRAMHAMLQAEKPEDFIIASGELHCIRDFIEIAFKRAGLDWTPYVRKDAGVHEPVSRSVYRGDISAIRNRLGWEPKTSFTELVNMMVDHYLQKTT